MKQIQVGNQLRISSASRRPMRVCPDRKETNMSSSLPVRMARGDDQPVAGDRIHWIEASNASPMGRQRRIDAAFTVAAAQAVASGHAATAAVSIDSSTARPAMRSAGCS
jgi:hypothetical protein